MLPKPEVSFEQAKCVELRRIKRRTRPVLKDAAVYYITFEYLNSLKAMEESMCI